MVPETTDAVSAWPMAAFAGIGLRDPHLSEFLRQKPDLGWVEVHSENFFSASVRELRGLDSVREDYELSLHGVGMSVGSADALNPDHIRNLNRLIERYEPCFVSDHLSWSSIDGAYFNDLLPLPYTEESLDHVVERVNVIQAEINHRILLENISSYLTVSFSAISEWEFLNAVAKRTGCGILLDVNNLYVNANNHGFNADQYLREISGQDVVEYHLGGFTEVDVDGQRLLIDTHDHEVSDDVWELYRQTLRVLGPRPTLIEWDAELPELVALVAIADHAGYELARANESS